MPIMWYATCDLEYEKDEETYLLKQEKKERDGDNRIQSKNATHIQQSEISRENKYFLKNPDLYEIGLNKECFSYFLLAKNIVYALWHAFVVYMACLFAIS